MNIGGNEATSGNGTIGFRPTARRRNRLIGGVALGALAIGGNVLAYSSLDDHSTAVQVVRDVPAGEAITIDMLRPVDADVDATVNVVSGDDIGRLVGSYAKVRLVSGSLVTDAALQPTPLLSEGGAVVAIEVSEGELPTGLRERVPIHLVIPDDRTSEDSAITIVEARVVGLPRTTNNGVGNVSLSVEVDETDAPIIAAASTVRVVLLQPSPDPASAGDL